LLSTGDGCHRQRTNVVDEHTRGALTMAVDRRIDVDAIVAVLDRLVAERLRCLPGRCWLSGRPRLRIWRLGADRRSSSAGECVVAVVVACLVL
jgi:hypothetical protein